jgi:prepilin-type N-terminal cleavage/methylation domain-containing protein/prepilin-type processing-associated H-X9-DG protein
MRRTKAFTLIELMVVVSIIALLAMMLVPALQRALEMTRRANCVANLKGAGTALALYAQNYDNTYPMIFGAGWDTVVDGTNNLASYSGNTSTGVVATDWAVTRSVTSLMFMLVRNGESPKLFVCPSDGGAKADTHTTDPLSTPAGALNYDFTLAATNSARCTSYSYQTPINRAGGTNDRNGVPTSPDANLVVMADRNPDSSKGAAGCKSSSAAYAGDANSAGTWSATNNTAANLPHYNSQNHTNGEMMNALYVDGHAAAVRNPNAGPTITSDGNPDCIFSAYTTTGVNSDDGSDYAGSASAVLHTGTKDVYLWGSAGQ